MSNDVTCSKVVSRRETVATDVSTPKAYDVINLCNFVTFVNKTRCDIVLTCRVSVDSEYYAIFTDVLRLLR